MSISSDSVYDSVVYDPVKTRKQELKNQPITRSGIELCDWFFSSTFVSSSNNLVFIAL